MKNNRIEFALICLVIFSSVAFSLSATARNTLEYRAAESDKGDSFLEDRLDLRMSISNISMGIRFEAMQPSRSSALTRPDSTYTAITQRWAEMMTDKFTITAGTFTKTMGKGFLLDARERLEIQEDHHLDGVNLDVDFSEVEIEFLAGNADWDNYSLFKAGQITSNWEYFPVNTGYIRFDVNGEDPLPDLIGETWSVGMAKDIGDFYAELRYANTWQGPAGAGVNYRGEAYYVNSSAIIGPIVLYGEFLEADSFLVKGYTQEYATLPLIVRQPSYTLLSRHLMELDPRNVTAFNANAMIYPIFDFEIDLSGAVVMKDSSDLVYYETYGSLSRDWKKFSLKGIYEYQDFANDDYFHNIVLEPLYYIADDKSFVLDLEFQSGTEYGESFSNFYALGELAISSLGSIGLEGGQLTESDGDKENFGRVYIDTYIAENHKLTLGYGRRPGGFTCSGGNCRYEPRFEGFELKLSSSF